MHKRSDSSLINMVNYMACSTTYSGTEGHWIFYSFVEVRGSKYWALEHEGKYYSAVKISTEEVDYCVSDDEDREEMDLENELLWVCMFKGTDNTSYMKRFSSQCTMMQYLVDLEYLDNSDPSILYYNS